MKTFKLLRYGRAMRKVSLAVDPFGPITLTALETLKQNERADIRQGETEFSRFFFLTAQHL